MALQFIMGNSGSGKSHILYEKIIHESIRHPERNYMVIVPEQFTMQTQKDLVMLHPDRGIMNIDVLSFRRLAHRIFEEVGADRRTVLTETGKNLMLRRVAAMHQDELQILGGKMNRTGYVSEVKSILSELMQYEITDFDLQEMLDFTEDRPLLHSKLSDIRLLYRAFARYQRDRFMKPEELLDVLCQVAGKSKLLRNSTLAFDGFTGFTPSQMKVLEELLSLCPMVWITVTFDVRLSIYGEIQEHELFALSRKMFRGVTEAAKGETVLPPVLLGRDSLPRFKAGGALEHLERNLFRQKRSAYQGVSEEISLHVSPTLADEVHFAARTISRLVREEGCRYHEIAVITGSLGDYDYYVKRIFPMYEIPAFLDETRHILLNPCLEFVRGALSVAEQDFSSESVFRFLRTGMAGLTSEEIDRLENYVLAAGIRGQRLWESEWTWCMGSAREEGMDYYNALRQRAAACLIPFTAVLQQKQAPLLEYANALYELLERCQVQQYLKDRETELLQEGRREEAREYSQIYSVLIALLDEMADLMGDEKVSGKEFGEILDAGFAEAKVGIIPPGIDQVQVGDITRSRLAHIKVLFFLGLNDGWVPAAGSKGSIVSDTERELLREKGIELAPTARENSYIQRFYLYQNLTKAGEHLYLSWCGSSGDGTAMRPSYLVNTVRRLFPGLEVIHEQEAGASIAQVTSRKNGMLYLMRGLETIRDTRPEGSWMELYRRYLGRDGYRERVQELVKAAFSRGSQGRLSFTVARELYGDEMMGSVTRLENFAACAFAHFAAYGLRLTQRELFGVKPTDLGTIFHQALELYSRRLQIQQKKWDEIPEEEQNALMEQCVDQVAQEYGGGALHENARSEYTIRRVKRILCRTIWAMHQQIRAGSFQPVSFEVAFAEELDAVHVRFGGQGHLRLQGRIDRIDTAETSDTVYVKIVDYKSGAAQFDPVSIYYGLQLQLLVYLNAALEIQRKQYGTKEVIPAGIFYYHLEDPVLEKDEDGTDTQAQEKLLKKLRPSGVLNSDGEILHMLDHQISGDSLVIPAGLKKDGSLKAASSAVNTQQFRELSQYVNYKMEDMAEQILQGEISTKPFSDGKRSACDYCAYQEVCGFDRKLPGMCEKWMPELKKDEVWARITEVLKEI